MDKIIHKSAVISEGTPNQHTLHWYNWGTFTSKTWRSAATAKAQATRHAKRGLSPHHRTKG